MATTPTTVDKAMVTLMLVDIPPVSSDSVLASSGSKLAASEASWINERVDVAWGLCVAAVELMVNCDSAIPSGMLSSALNAPGALEAPEAAVSPAAILGCCIVQGESCSSVETYLQL